MNEERKEFIQEVHEWLETSEKKLPLTKELRFFRRLKRVVGVVIVLVVLFGGTVWGVYQRGWDNWWTRIALRFLNPPIAEVGESKISFREYFKERAPVEFAMKKGENIEMSEEDISSLVFKKLIENEIVRILLEEKGIVVNHIELESAQGKYFPSISQEMLIRGVFETYHLLPKDFEEIVLRPLLEREKLEEELGSLSAVNVAIQKFRSENKIKIYLESK